MLAPAATVVVAVAAATAMAADGSCGNGGHSDCASGGGSSSGSGADHGVAPAQYICRLCERARASPVMVLCLHCIHMCDKSFVP